MTLRQANSKRSDLLALAVSCLAMFDPTLAIKNHFSSPSEDNVFSPRVCSTNQDGFGGIVSNNVLPVQYYYELELVPDPEEDLEDIIFKLERSIA